MQLVMWEERPGRSCLNRPRAPDRARALSPARPTHSYDIMEGVWSKGLRGGKAHPAIIKVKKIKKGIERSREWERLLKVSRRGLISARPTRCPPRDLSQAPRINPMAGSQLCATLLRGGWVTEQPQHSHGLALWLHLSMSSRESCNSLCGRRGPDVPA